MMINRVIAILMFCSMCFAAENWNGWSDTTSFNDTLANGEIEYGAAFSLSGGEDIRWVMCVDDTSSAGFASDSINVAWGYQTGSIILDSTLANRDTSWDAKIVIDTMVTASFGDLTNGRVDSSGNLIRTWSKEADTANVTGFAYQSRWFVPEWDVIYRPFVIGITGNKQASALKAYLFIMRRQYVQTRGK